MDVLLYILVCFSFFVGDGVAYVVARNRLGAPKRWYGHYPGGGFVLLVRTLLARRSA